MWSKYTLRQNMIGIFKTLLFKVGPYQPTEINFFHCCLTIWRRTTVYSVQKFTQQTA